MSCCMCMYVHICMYFLQPKVLGASIQTNMHTYAHTYNIKQKYAHICTTYARHIHTYAQIHALSTRVRCKVNLYVSVCILMYVYVSLLYVLGGAYLYLYVFICMYLHVSCAYITTCISVFRNAYVQNSCICMYHVCIMYVCVFLHVSGMYHVCASMCMYGMYWPNKMLLPP